MPLGNFGDDGRLSYGTWLPAYRKLKQDFVRRLSRSSKIFGTGRERRVRGARERRKTSRQAISPHFGWRADRGTLGSVSAPTHHRSTSFHRPTPDNYCAPVIETMGVPLGTEQLCGCPPGSPGFLEEWVSWVSPWFWFFMGVTLVFLWVFPWFFSLVFLNFPVTGRAVNEQGSDRSRSAPGIPCPGKVLCPQLARCVKIFTSNEWVAPSSDPQCGFFMRKNDRTRPQVFAIVHDQCHESQKASCH